MKKLLLGVLVLALGFTLSACKDDKKEQNDAPVFTGETTLEVEVGDTEPNWLDLVSVTDTEDGDIVLDSTNVDGSSVDMDTEGTFEVVYSVTDSGGKTSEFTLTVTVVKPLIPMISNPTDAYATIGDVVLTREDVWNEMLKGYGLGMLSRYIEEITFSEEIASISEEQYLDAKNILLFGTNDEEIIQDMMNDPVYYNRLVESFNETLLFAGYDPDDEEQVKSYLALDIAKRIYSEEYIRTAESGDGFNITDTQLENFYYEQYIGDVCALSVVFNSSKEFDNVLDRFNLVDNYNYGIGEYIGSQPITELSSDMFNDTNTNELADEDVFTYFVQLYNYMNPHLTQLPEDITETEFCQNYPEVGNHNYDELTANISFVNHPLNAYATLIFETLKVNQESSIRYTYTDNNISGDHVIAYKVSQEDVPSFDTLTAEELVDVKEEFINLMMIQDVIETLSADKMEEIDIVIYEPALRKAYEQDGGDSEGVPQSDTLIASYGDIEVTADQLFDYIDAYLGTVIVQRLFEKELLINSDFFTERFGDVTDLANSTNELVQGYYEQMDLLVANFYAGSYIQYGFDPNVISLEDFYYLGFGENNLDDIILNVFVLPNLQVDYALEGLPSYEELQTHFELNYEDYFSVAVEHILIYLDLDRDFIPDAFDDYIDGLSEVELAEYNALKVQFESLIIERVESGMNLTQVESEYNSGLIDDIENPWASFKQYGFRIKAENLSVLEYTAVEQYDENFMTSVERLNEMLRREENEAVERMYDTQLTTSVFGVHFLSATRSSQFEVPSAVFAETDPINPVYSEGSENDNNILSESQLEVYKLVTVPTLLGETSEYSIPGSVLEAVNEFYKPLFDQYVSDWGTLILSIEEILESSPVFETDQAEKLALLQKQLDLVKSQSILRTE